MDEKKKLNKLVELMVSSARAHIYTTHTNVHTLHPTHTDIHAYIPTHTTTHTHTHTHTHTRLTWIKILRAARAPNRSDSYLPVYIW